MTVFPPPSPHKFIKCTESPKRNDGWPVNTIEGVLKLLLKPPEKKETRSFPNNSNNITKTVKYLPS